MIGIFLEGCHSAVPSWEGMSKVASALAVYASMNMCTVLAACGKSGDWIRAFAKRVIQQRGSGRAVA